MERLYNLTIIFCFITFSAIVEQVFVLRQRPERVGLPTVPQRTRKVNPGIIIATIVSRNRKLSAHLEWSTVVD